MVVWYSVCHFLVGEWRATLQATGHFRWFLGLGLAAALLVLIMTGACSRPTHVNDGTASDPAGKTPFNQDAGATAGPGVAESQLEADGSNREGTPTGVPFNASGSRHVPMGTLLAVRLESSFSSARIQAGRTFSAVLDEPIIVEGDTIVPPGATVKGRVESARASGPNVNSGYLRLTLESMQIAGKEIPLQTSSLFARDNGSELSDLKADFGGRGPKPAGMRNAKLKKGRRLTFRLITPLELVPAGDESSGQSSVSSND